MAKRTTASVAMLKPDVKYGNKVIAKFINCLMYEGKKTVAESIFYDALDALGKKIKDEKPEDVFLKALENLKPEIEVRSKRVGGQTYQVPMPVSPKRRQALAMKWLREVARGKKGRTMAQKLADEIIAAYKKEGDAITKRENVHKMAEANKLFAHFAW
jgi:small subunit ribosomal protein S7